MPDDFTSSAGLLFAIPFGHTMKTATVCGMINTGGGSGPPTIHFNRSNVPMADSGCKGRCGRCRYTSESYGIETSLEHSTNLTNLALL
jgi:hypothetical protein